MMFNTHNVVAAMVCRKDVPYNNILRTFFLTDMAQIKTTLSPQSEAETHHRQVWKKSKFYTNRFLSHLQW